MPFKNYNARRRRAFGRRRKFNRKTAPGLVGLGGVRNNPMSRNATQWQKTPYAYATGSAKVIGGNIIAKGYMPPTLFCQFRYSQQVTLSNDNTTGRTGSEHAWRLNSLFDPDFTAVGHQPRGFDQMAAIYNKYVVYKVHIQLRKLQHTFGSDTGNFIALNVRQGDNAYVLSGVKTADEIQEVAGNTVIGLSAQAERMVDYEFYIADLLGIPRTQIFNDELYGAATNANPSRTAYTSVAMGNFNDVTGQSAIVLMSMVFYARMQNPGTPLQS